MKIKGKVSRKLAGFTMVEMLIVITIVAVLAGLSAVGLAYAMRSSRNVQRATALSNLEKALQSYYADYQKYPAGTYNVEELLDEDNDILYEYLEGSWKAPDQTEFFYMTDSANGDVNYVACVSKEKAGGELDYICAGPGLGQDNFPQTSEMEDQCSGCTNCCLWTNDASGGSCDGNGCSGGGGGAGVTVD